MSFFGFEQNDLEQEKLRFQEKGVRVAEDVAIYTWGEEGYDGLGDLLQEGRDELNDETFGGTGAVGKDFDFSNPALPDPIHPVKESHPAVQDQAHQTSRTPSARPTQTPRSTTQSLEAIWDDRSPFSVLPRTNGAGRSAVHEAHRASPSSSRFSPFAEAEPAAHQQGHVHSRGPLGIRTLQEIEAEMQAAAQQSRTALVQRQLQQQQQQQQLMQQQEEEALRLLQQQEEQEHQRQQILQYQEQQHQLQLQRALQQQQREQQHLQRTPPPRMIPGASQSPRFHEHQRQILLLQQQQEQQQQQRLLELQEQLRYEEMERQMMARMTLQQSHSPNHFVHRRQPSGPTAAEIQAAQVLQQQRRQRSRSPAVNHNNFPVPLQEGLPYLPQNIQLQQRLLSELAQAEFLREMQGATSQAEQEALRAEAMRKIVEAEKMEEKRRKKAAKIAHMARYNDLMTQSDKDFITRIQVSQLVTQDPYADDFYAQVYGAILRSRMGMQAPDERVLKFHSGGGVGLGLAQKAGNRRPNAMLRMEQQVERIVSNARKREEEKGLHSLHSLQGALGKTSGRSYKAAPRQLLQVDSSTPGSPTVSPAHAHISKDSIHKPNEGAAKEAAKLGREALGNAGDTDGLIRKEPLSQREILIALEYLYDLVLNTESIKRNEPTPEDSEEYITQWQKEYDQAVDQLWDGLKVMVPLETSNPHPFISLLIPSKGKKILPRVTRHLSNQRMFTLLTLLVACFDQLDVVQNAHILDTYEETKEKAEVERQSEAFLQGVLQSILPVVARADLRLVTGLLGLLLDRTNVIRVAQSAAGIALLTMFLSRVEVMKQALASGVELTEVPTAEEAQQWQLMFDHLFQFLAPHLPSLFPSTRIQAHIPPGHGYLSPDADHADQPVWQLLAAIALHAVTEQHEVLVTALRNKILDIMKTVNKGWVATEEERLTKLANVNLFLHALGLDSSQIAL
ncbi:DNA topoisomerase 2-associated protein pat1 [Hypsizygus marmoreus]|uniref:DNA topoisomerase 2-associated protein pat1 n=1 Tax=Hypsizygus marmoreus TaxID=39966 RepID=A0A369JHM3_HYPMA|nr:DNA topoisomerase 2-associated protein pat1 [Hypsizygus marmoreus]